jgi:hypothetical protein
MNLRSGKVLQLSHPYYFLEMEAIDGNMSRKSAAGTKIEQGRPEYEAQC